MAQELQRVFTGTTHRLEGGGAPHFSYAKADRRVTAYYFYLVDEAFGPAFVKIYAYFPYPVKIWCNGHEYAKRAAAKAGYRPAGGDADHIRPPGSDCTRVKATGPGCCVRVTT